MNEVTRRPNPRLQRTRATRSPLSRQPLGDDGTEKAAVNPQRYGARTWLDAKRHRFSIFTPAQAQAILSYLRYKAELDINGRKEIEEAIKNYWSGRAA